MSIRKDFSSVPELVPYLIPCSMGNWRVFSRSLISSQFSGSNGII